MSTSDGRKNLYVALLIFAIAAGFLGWAYTYGPQTRMVPVLVGWMTVVLCMLDVLAHTESRAGRTLALWLSGPHQPTRSEPLRRSGEAAACLWMAGALVLVVLAGFVIAVPVYIFTYMVLRGRRSLIESGLTALGSVLFVWLVFEELMEYELYSGLLAGL